MVKCLTLPLDLATVSGFAINFKPILVLWNQAFWVVAPCGCVIPSRRFEGTYRFYLQIYESVH